MWRVGETSTEWTPFSPLAITRAFEEKAVRAALRWIARSEPVSTSPKTNCPPNDGMPHPWQNAAPVIPIVEAVNHFGRCRGFGPELFVPAGFDSEHDSLGPQPKLPPFTTRLISSVHVGPFSVSHRRCVTGSNVNPNELRWPYDQMRLPNGLPLAPVPSGSSRRILPRRLSERSCAFALWWPSPIPTKSFPPGPNRIRPPLWYGSALAGLLSSTLRPRPLPPDTANRTS